MPINLLKSFCQYVPLECKQSSFFPQGQKTLQGLSPLFLPHHNTKLTPSIVAVCSIENTTIIKLSSSKYLSSANWIIWHEKMIIMLELCEVYEYTQGLVEKPNSFMDPQGAKNWTKNDDYTKHLTSNISTTEMMNLG